MGWGGGEHRCTECGCTEAEIRKSRECKNTEVMEKHELQRLGRDCVDTVERHSESKKD